MPVWLHLIPSKREPDLRGGGSGDAILAYTTCAERGEHRAYRLPYADAWRLEPFADKWGIVERSAPLAITYGAPLGDPERQVAALRFDERELPELERIPLRPLQDLFLTRVLATFGLGSGPSCGVPPELQARSFLVAGEGDCVSARRCQHDALYIAMLDCLDPARHALFELPRFPRWVKPPVDGFDEASTGTSEQSEDSRGIALDSGFSRAVLLEWSGAVPTQGPGGEVAWQRTDFELVVSPDGATLFRKGELPPAVANRLRWERSSGH